MRIDFDRRVVIVTGAAQGIGRAIAAGFVDAGAVVYLADRDAEGLRTAAQQLTAGFHQAALISSAAALKAPPMAMPLPPTGRVRNSAARVPASL